MSISLVQDTTFVSLKQGVYEANLASVRAGLVVLTWGNASGLDRSQGYSPLTQAAPRILPCVSKTWFLCLWRQGKRCPIRLFVLVTDDDVVHGKPAPNLFLLAAEKLDVAPADCIVYEDGGPGVKAAHRTGMRVVDVRVLLR